MSGDVYTERYLDEVVRVAAGLDRGQIMDMVGILQRVRRERGRMFVIGVGGSAGNASHAVNDFRKIAGIEAYAPTDNVSELTARVNDEGWESSFAAWLEVSHLAPQDVVMVLSVGGGSPERNVSMNIVRALELAKKVGATVIGIVGRDGGYTAQVAEACVIVPSPSPDTITPHTEAFQAVVWHLIVSHPDLQLNPMKWESTV